MACKKSPRLMFRTSACSRLIAISAASIKNVLSLVLDMSQSPKSDKRIALIALGVALVALTWGPHLLIAGEPVGEVLTLAQGGGLPAAASLPESDRFLVVWDMGLTLVDGASLRARFVDSSGQPVGSEFTPIGPRERAGIPSLTANPEAREFLVTWWDFRENLGDIFGQRLAEDGSLIGDDFLIVQASNFENWPPAVAYNPNSDEYLVVWYEIRGELGESSIYGQRVSAAGSLVGNVILIGDQGSPEVRPAIAANGATGDYLVVWSLIDPDLQANLLGQRLTATGDHIGQPFLIGQGDKPAVTYANPGPSTGDFFKGEYLVVWANGQAEAARVQSDGSVLGGIFLSEPGNSKNFSDVASGAAGGYLAVWEGPGGDGFLTTILGRELSSTGELISIPWPLSGASGRNISYPAVAYNFQADVYLVVWEEWNEGARLVRGRIYQPGEAPLPPGPPAALINGDFEDGFYTLTLPAFAGQSIANGWAPFVLAGQPSFAGERSTVHGGRWAYKVSSYAPFVGGLAQVVPVQPGRTYRVTAYYQLYPPGDGRASLGVRDGASAVQWVSDSWPGVWRSLSQVVTATSDRLTITLQGNNGADPNTNVYFDDVTVVTVGGP
jgi:hypothetical protein